MSLTIHQSDNGNSRIYDHFVETDNTGKMIKAFHPGYKTDRVAKNDFMDFWFY